MNKLEEALSMLKHVQWVEYYNPDSGIDCFCPVCRADMNVGHYASCELANLINRIQQELAVKKTE
jgi:hypothetical protein